MRAEKRYKKNSQPPASCREPRRPLGVPPGRGGGPAYLSTLPPPQGAIHTPKLHSDQPSTHTAEKSMALIRAHLVVPGTQLPVFSADGDVNVCCVEVMNSVW